MSTQLEMQIRIEDSFGVCGVRDDTRLLAEASLAVLDESGNPGRALDLGTGSGYVAIHLALRGRQVEAVDVSPRAVELTRHNAALNGLVFPVYESDLFSAVRGPYTVIAFNPPMRADETEGSRILTSTLRRVGIVANVLMRVTQPLLERKRLGFLAEIARSARPHLVANGRLILVISPLEQTELLRLVPELFVVAAQPVPTIPGLLVVIFGYHSAAPAVAQ